jgi:hypothetical protein
MLFRISPFLSLIVAKMQTEKLKEGKVTPTKVLFFMERKAI